MESLKSGALVLGSLVALEAAMLEIRALVIPGACHLNEIFDWLSAQVSLLKIDPTLPVFDQKTSALTEAVVPTPTPEPVPKPEIQATTVPEPEPKVTPEHKTPEPRAVVRDYDLARLNLSQLAHPSEMTSRLPTTEEVASLSYNMRNMYGIELTESQIETAFRDGYVEIRGERFQLWENNKTPEFYLTPAPSVR